MKVFWSNFYDVHDITNQILSRGSNYIVDVAMQP